MTKRKNSYQKAALKKSLSGTGDASTGEKVKDAATELGKDIVIGVIGGGGAEVVLHGHVGRIVELVGNLCVGPDHARDDIFPKNK